VTTRDIIRVSSRSIEFQGMAADASTCRLCERMCGPAVLSGRNGPLSARVLFVAEAPGRLGAARTGVPLSGDQSGRNFERLLQAASLKRSDVFVTNAVLCNPQDSRGRNAPPTRTEIEHCSRYLLQTIELVDPLVVVSLGTVALTALNLIAPHGATLRREVSQVVPWADRLLVPLYHPSPRAQLSRSFVKQMEDFRRLRDILRQAIIA